MKKRKLLLGALILGVAALTACGENNNSSTLSPTPTPEPTYEHTYSTEWSKNETKHWHVSICGHDLKKDESDHTWNNGAETTNGTKFTCTVCGYEKTEPSKYQVNETKWKEILNNTLNYTLEETIPQGNTSMLQNIYFTENGVLIDLADYKDLLSKENDKYYHYRLVSCETEWSKEEITEKDYNNYWENSLSVFVNEYSKFTYETKTKKYTLSSLDVSDIASSSSGHTTLLQNISIGFEDGKLSSLNYTMTMNNSGYNALAQLVYKDFGTTTITIPINIHKHTFSGEWTKDENKHWHVSTCGHNIKSDEGEHIWNEDAICTVCGMKDESIKYELSEDGNSYYVAGFVWRDTENVVIVRTYNGKPVTSIGDSAFYWRHLKKITIPDTVTNIGEFAFCNSDLIDIVIPDSVTTIGKAAFSGCSSLVSASIGNGVTSIGISVFSDCSSLTSIIIPDNLTSIGECAFYNSDLTSITIPNTVTSIGDEAFYNCNCLVEVINKSSLDIVKGKSDYGFIAKYALDVKNDGETNIANIDDFLFYTIDGINYLIKYAGRNLSLVLPDNYNGESYEIYKYAFYFKDFTSVVISDSVTNIGENAFSNCENLTNIEIGNGVTNISENAFYFCTNLENLIIGNSVTTIGTSAFSACNSLISVKIPNSVKSIGEKAFDYCVGLKNITIPNGVISIGDGAFSGCQALITIEIPDSVISIGESVFSNCTSLENLILGNSITRIEEYTFYGCGSLINVEIPENVTSIGECAFYRCDSLISVKVPESVTSIGKYAFYGCTSLTIFLIPESVTSIEEYAFYCCSSLTSVVIPNAVKSIGEYAFFECGSLRNVTIGTGVTSIGKYAFASCTNLKNLIIGSGVRTISNYAFYGCDCLANVYYMGTVDNWNSIYIYSNNSNLTSANHYYYTDTQSIDTTYKYWHYVDGVPTAW